MTPAVSLFLVFALLVPQPQRLNLGQPKMAVDLVVTGPKEANPGDLVALSSEDSQGVSATTWAVSPKSAQGRMMVFENGTKAVFASGTPGTYLFFLGGCSADGKTIRIVSHEVVVGGSPNPPPGPQPTPPGPTPPSPVPVPPEPVPDRYGLAAKVKEWTSSVTDSDKALHCKQIASFLDDITKGINDGSLKDEDAVLKKMANIRSIFSQWPYITQGRWMFLRSTLLNELDKIFPKDKSPHPVANYAQAFSELSTGLKGVQ